MRTALSGPLRHFRSIGTPATLDSCVEKNTTANGCLDTRSVGGEEGTVRPSSPGETNSSGPETTRNDSSSRYSACERQLSLVRQGEI